MIIIIDKARIIPSVVRYDQLDAAMKSNCSRINVLVGSILDIHEISSGLKEKGKKVFIHIEMIDGLGNDAAVVTYLKECGRVDGIITTKSNLVSSAKTCGLLTVQRIFAIDTQALKSAIRIVNNSHPDEVELMPGLMLGIIKKAKNGWTGL